MIGFVRNLVYVVAIMIKNTRHINVIILKTTLDCSFRFSTFFLPASLLSLKYFDTLETSSSTSSDTDFTESLYIFIA